MKFPSKYMFPDPRNAPGDQPLAAGGDLNPQTILHAYSRGIFPWFTEDYPILWWSPDPRMVLFPGQLKVSKSLQQVIRSAKFEIRFDSCFQDVILACSKIRRSDQSGTWITPEIVNTFISLNKMGYAHSVETFYHGRLVGGLYGLALGAAFFGESMFHVESDASKVALYYLVNKITSMGFMIIDVQQSTEHLARLGAREIPRLEFLDILKEALEMPPRPGKWQVSIG